MNKLETLIDLAKVNELLGRKEKEEEKKCNIWLWILAAIGAVAAIAAIAYVVYRHFNPDYLEDFEDEFEDEFEDPFEDEDGVFEDGE
ncbi:MAG: hypothetical protein J1E65_08970 [Lachnospiraceae bacterium]|nr:hypothetical protein [Lachnospiraceae bacterium]